MTKSSWIYKRHIAGIALITGLLSLTGCTLAYDIEVLRLDGRLIFDMSHKRLFYGSEDACIEELTVREVSYEQPVVWHLRASGDACRDVRRLQYGATPAGVEVVVPVHKLRPGQLYTISLRALGGGGLQTFVIAPDDRDLFGPVSVIP